MSRSRSITLVLGWVAALGLGLLAPADPQVVRWIVLTAIVVLGTPHGALDALLLLRGTPRAVATRTAVYVLAVAATAGLWWFLPVVCVPAFFVLAAWHFGEGEGAAAGVSTERPGRRGRVDWAAGILPLAAPFAFQPGPTTDLVGALFLGHAPSSWAPIAQVSGLAAVALATIVGLFRNRRTSPEILSTLLWFAWLPPLSAFAVWYLAVHSGRHLVRLAGSMRAPGPVFGLGLAGVVLGGFACWWAASSPRITEVVKDPASFQTSVAIVFIALAALTVPHAILVQRTLGEPRR